MAGGSQRTASGHRTGVVVARDPAGHRVRVEFPDADGLVSAWLPALTASTKADRSYALPDVGEHVVCLIDDRLEQGVCAGAIYSAPEPPAQTDGEVRQHRFADGSVLTYDRAGHALTLEVIPTGTLTLRVGRSELVMRDSEVVLRAPLFRGEQS